jgi:hypothetical protein
MIFPHTRSCSIAATMLWLGIAQAAPANAPEQQRGFASPEGAVTAFVAALRNHNEADLRAILGPDGGRVIDSGDRYADRELQGRFVALYDEKHAIDLAGAGRAELAVGANDWPLPIPLVESDGRWTFDTRPGRRPSSTGGSVVTSCLRSARCSPASMLSAIISIAPSKETEPDFMPHVWSARRGTVTAFIGP